MRLHISWILLVSSVSLSTAELPSDNDKEGNKKTDVYPGCSITLYKMQKPLTSRVRADIARCNDSKILMVAGKKVVLF